MGEKATVNDGAVGRAPSAARVKGPHWGHMTYRNGPKSSPAPSIPTRRLCRMFPRTPRPAEALPDDLKSAVPSRGREGSTPSPGIESPAMQVFLRLPFIRSDNALDGRGHFGATRRLIPQARAACRVVGSRSVASENRVGFGVPAPFVADHREVSRPRSCGARRHARLRMGPGGTPNANLAGRVRRGAAAWLSGGGGIEPSSDPSRNGLEIYQCERFAGLFVLVRQSVRQSVEVHFL
jgi:hypothetical protein